MALKAYFEEKLQLLNAVYPEWKTLTSGRPICIPEALDIKTYFRGPRNDDETYMSVVISSFFHKDLYLLLDVYRRYFDTIRDTVCETILVSAAISHEILANYFLTFNHSLFATMSKEEIKTARAHATHIKGDDGEIAVLHAFQRSNVGGILLGDFECDDFLLKLPMNMRNDNEFKFQCDFLFFHPYLGIHIIEARNSESNDKDIDLFDLIDKKLKKFTNPESNYLQKIRKLYTLLNGLNPKITLDNENIPKLTGVIFYPSADFSVEARNRVYERYGIICLDKTALDKNVLNPIFNSAAFAGNSDNLFELPHFERFISTVSFFRSEQYWRPAANALAISCMIDKGYERVDTILIENLSNNKTKECDLESFLKLTDRRQLYFGDKVANSLNTTMVLENVKAARKIEEERRNEGHTTRAIKVRLGFRCDAEYDYYGDLRKADKCENISIASQFNMKNLEIINNEDHFFGVFESDFLLKNVDSVTKSDSKKTPDVDYFSSFVKKRSDLEEVFTVIVLFYRSCVEDISILKFNFNNKIQASFINNNITENIEKFEVFCFKNSIRDNRKKNYSTINNFLIAKRKNTDDPNIESQNQVNDQHEALFLNYEHNTYYESKNKRQLYFGDKIENNCNTMMILKNVEAARKLEAEQRNKKQKSRAIKVALGLQCDAEYDHYNYLCNAETCEKISIANQFNMENLENIDNEDHFFGIFAYDLMTKYAIFDTKADSEKTCDDDNFSSFMKKRSDLKEVYTAIVILYHPHVNDINDLKLKFQEEFNFIMNKNFNNIIEKFEVFCFKNLPNDKKENIVEINSFLIAKMNNFNAYQTQRWNPFNGRRELFCLNSEQKIFNVSSNKRQLYFGYPGTGKTVMVMLAIEKAANEDVENLLRYGKNCRNIKVMLGSKRLIRKYENVCKALEKTLGTSRIANGRRNRRYLNIRTYVRSVKGGLTQQNLSEIKDIDHFFVDELLFANSQWKEFLKHRSTLDKVYTVIAFSGRSFDHDIEELIGKLEEESISDGFEVCHYKSFMRGTQSILNYCIKNYFNAKNKPNFGHNIFGSEVIKETYTTANKVVEAVLKYIELFSFKDPNKKLRRSHIAVLTSIIGADKMVKTALNHEDIPYQYIDEVDKKKVHDHKKVRDHNKVIIDSNNYVLSQEFPIVIAVNYYGVELATETLSFTLATRARARLIVIERNRMAIQEKIDEEIDIWKQSNPQVEVTEKIISDALEEAIKSLGEINNDEELTDWDKSLAMLRYDIAPKEAEDVNPDLKNCKLFSDMLNKLCNEEQYKKSMEEFVAHTAQEDNGVVSFEVLLLRLKNREREGFLQLINLKSDHIREALLNFYKKWLEAAQGFMKPLCAGNEGNEGTQQQTNVKADKIKFQSLIRALFTVG